MALSFSIGWFGLKHNNMIYNLGKMLVDGMEKQELKLREYQEELVKPALKGKNTIICAPTGSGKTFVAMEAIKHHVAKSDRKYVVFIVNTLSLVEQQETCLQKYLPEPVDVSSVCGSNQDMSLPSVLEENDVVVVTAQVLLNALRKKRTSEDGVQDEKHVSISQFALLVFDECHHTTKEHPYNEIMRWYMKEKYEACTNMYLLLCRYLGCSLLIFLCFKHASSSGLRSLIVNSLMFSLLLSWLALVSRVVVVIICGFCRFGLCSFSCLLL